MLQLFKNMITKSGNDSRQAEDFIVAEKTRRTKVKNFIQQAAALIASVAEDVWGIIPAGVLVPISNDSVKLTFDVKKKLFYVESNGQFLLYNVKGKLYWDCVQRINAFVESLVDDISRRNEGREKLVEDMLSLTERISHAKNNLLHLEEEFPQPEQMELYVPKSAKREVV